MSLYRRGREHLRQRSPCKPANLNKAAEMGLERWLRLLEFRPVKIDIFTPLLAQKTAPAG
jgi:hypothetical protein